METALPKWDLSDLYKDIKDKNLLKDKDLIQRKTEKFVVNYKNNINESLNANDFVKIIKEYETIQTLITKIMSFSYLLYSTDVNNKENSNFLQQNREFFQNINSQLVFFDLSINLIKEETIKIWLNTSTELKLYESFLKQVRLFKPYQLSELAEQVLIAKQTVSRTSWVKLYDVTLASLQFDDPLNSNKKISLSNILNLQLNKDSHIRNEAATSLKEGLKVKEDIIVTTINNIIKDHAVNNQLRGFKKSYSSMNLSNLIEDQVMENLVDSVSSSYSDISNRYYNIKSKILGLDKLNYWDRNAPLFESNNKFSFTEAKDIVLKAFEKFNPQFAEIALKFFDNNWIDARLLPNKMSGAFSHPTSVEVHPYVLVNFHNGYIDVTTLAHELGHGVHQFLSRETGELQSGTPLVLAETASIFAEELVFDYLKNSTQDEQLLKYLLSNKIEGIINSVHRQIAFHIFEVELHNFRAQGELTSDQIKEIFIKTQKDCLGEAIDLRLEDGIFWSYVSHFFHVPFYVYAYAFGDCLVRSLYSLYKSGDSNFMENYLSLLRSGGKLTPKSTIEKFGFDISKKDFWDKGLNITVKFIDELENII